MNGKGCVTKSAHVALPPVMRDMERAFRGRRDEIVGMLVREWIGRHGTEPTQETVNLYVTCVLPVPERTDEHTRLLMIGDKILPTEGPGAASVLSVVNAALEKVAYHDIGQIAETHIYRKYADEPALYVMLTGVKTRPYIVWNGTVIESVGVYDKEQTERGCTVQILENSVTGAVSVGWWKEDGEE